MGAKRSLSTPPLPHPPLKMSTIPIKDYIDSRFSEQEKRWVDRFELTRQAVETSAAQMDRRLEGMNEFREAIKDQAYRMATKDELETFRTTMKADLESLSTIVGDLRRARANLDGRIVVISSLVGGAFGLLTALLVVWVS